MLLSAKAGRILSLLIRAPTSAPFACVSEASADKSSLCKVHVYGLPSCSGQSESRLSTGAHAYGQYKGGRGHQRGKGTGTQPIVWSGFAWFAGITFKQWMGWEDYLKDDRAIQRQLEHAMSLMRSEPAKAEQMLRVCLHEAETKHDEMAITGCHEKLGDFYMHTDQMQKASEEYHVVLARLIKVHGVDEKHRSFILVSLHLAEVFTELGEQSLQKNNHRLRSPDETAVKARHDYRHTAEIGYTHCLEKQTMAVENHEREMQTFKAQTTYQVTKFDSLEGGHGPVMADPYVLLLMCYESYAKFLILDVSRGAEADSAFDKSLSVAHGLYGAINETLVTMLNNYATSCLAKNRFSQASKYLGEVVRRAEQLESLADLLPGFYCNYAEALFQNRQFEEAIRYAQKAQLLVRSSNDADLKNHVNNFVRHLECDVRNVRR